MLKILITILAIFTMGGAVWSADTTTPTSETTSTPIDKQDSDFVRNAAQGNVLEIRSSEIALKRGLLDGRDKEFAQMMIDDHKRVLKELVSVAEKKGMTLQSTTLDEKHQDKLDKLAKASDKDFAERYLESQISWHKEAISLFESESSKGKDADIKSFAIANLPTLKTHLEQCKKLESMH